MNASRAVQPIDPKNPPPVCTLPEGCVTARVSRATMNRWIATGRVRSVKLSNGMRRIETASLLSLLGVAE